MIEERIENKEKPFAGKKVYFSGSIRGVPHPDPEFFYNLVKYMSDNGADVLSEHVAARTNMEMNEIRTRRLGFDINELKNPRPAVRHNDIKWVDEADYVVAVVDTASTGVGMEIQEALRKHKMGMNLTPVLCLVMEERYENDLTWMVSGIDEEDSPVAEVRTYKDTKDAQRIITDFLTSK
jgi:nucleoside 2-deoxyribosyltransferase